MTTEDQNKDEKLQYDINREAAKISALSSGKLGKYEYLTGEEILTKTIKDQGKKQLKAIQDNKQLVNINKDYDYDYKDKLLLSKEREIFKDIYNKRLGKIEDFSNKIDYDDLIYVILNKDMKYNFSELPDPITFLNKIKNNEISIEEAKEYQQDYLNYFNIIRKGNKNTEQKKTLANINMLYNARNDAIKFIEDYGSMILKAKKLVKEPEGIGLKILTSNQMLKRLPIALAQVKTGNNSETLLNEIRQIVYSLYRSKEITKKVYNNIINSIKV